MRSTPLLGVTVIVSTVASCASVSTYKTSRPLGRGATEVLVAPQVSGSGPPGTEKAILPELAIGARRGVGDETDVMVTGVVLPAGDIATTWGLELAGKRRLWRSTSGRFELATGIAAGYRRTTSSNAGFEVVHGTVPAMIGITFSHSQVIVSPLFGWQRIYSPGAHPIDLPFAGASLGIDLAMTRSIHVLPEITWAASPTDGPDSDSVRMIHGGVAILYHRD